MSNGEEPRPGSYASLDGRVRVLEQTVALMARDIQHNTEMVGARLHAIEVTTEATAAGVKRIDDFITKAIVDPYSVNPRAREDVEEWRKWRAAVDADRERIDDARIAADTRDALTNEAGRRNRWFIGIVGGIVGLVGASAVGAILPVVLHH